jgi:hypothetical protein
MDPFCAKAFGFLVWRAFLTALITILLTIAYRLQLSVAFLAGANVALLFSFGLIVWAQRLTDERIVRTEAWQMLDSAERPAGVAGRRWACRHLSDEALLFAKGAAAVAVALSASALVFATD